MATAKYKKNSRGEFATKIWDGTYNSDGSKHRVNLKSKKSSADLERKVNALKLEVDTGLHTAYTDETFGNYADRWLSTKKSVREKNTQAMYRHVIDCHLCFLADVPLTDIRNSHFQQAINNAIDKPRTCQQIYITFRQIMRMACSDNLITEKAFKDICADISLPKYIKNEKRPLTPIEKAAMPQADFTNKQKAFVYIIYSCGVRRGEALALSKFDFKFDGGKSSVSINKTVIFGKNESEIKLIPKSMNGIRTIPIPKLFAAYLKEYITKLPTENLFTCADGSPITRAAYRRMWDSIIYKMNRAAGGTMAFPKISGLTAHIFRHNYCTNLCYQVPAISVKKIAQLMGDTEKMVLDVYNHIMEEKEDPEAVVENALAL